jgi:hypothetical protein
MAQPTHGRSGASFVARAEAEAGSGGDTAIKGVELEVCVTALQVQGCKAAAYRTHALCGVACVLSIKLGLTDSPPLGLDQAALP